MTRITGPDCAVIMCNFFINTHPHIWAGTGRGQEQGWRWRPEDELRGGNWDESRDGNESSSGDGNGDGNEARIREGGGETKRRA